MKKLILLVSALSLATASYAGAGGCGGCTGEKKPADAPAQPTDKAPETPKA